MAKKASKKAKKKAAKTAKAAKPLILEGQVYHPPGYRTVYDSGTASYRHVPLA